MKKLSKFATILLAVGFVLFSMTGCPEPTVDVSTGTNGTTGTTDTTYQFHSTVTYLAAGTDGSAGTEATYCTFGD